MDEFQSKAFEIDGEIEPDDNEPLTGEEYLKRVRWQSNRCPAVVVATNIDYNKLKFKTPSKNYFTLPPSITRCRKELLPTESWEKEFLNSFSEFRQRLKYLKENSNSSNLTIQLPHINDKRYWYIFCFGNDNSIQGNQYNNEEEDDNDDDEEEEEEVEQDEEYDEDQDMDYDEDQDMDGSEDLNNNNNNNNNKDNNKEIKSNKPTIEILCKLDHVLTVKLVNYHIEWLEKREFTQERSYWLYMLLSKLDKPIDPDTSSNLRSCLRRLSLFRSKIIDTTDPNLPSINILFTIISKYFEQLEPNEVLSL